MRKLSFSFWAGLLFILGGVVIAITSDFFAAVPSLTFGVSLLLLQPPSATVKAGDKRQFWGMKLTSRNIAALVFLVVSVVTFGVATWGDFAK